LLRPVFPVSFRRIIETRHYSSTPAAPLLYIPGAFGYVGCEPTPARVTMRTLTSGQELVFLLVLKVGLAASLAALLVRSATFRRVLYTEQRGSDLKVQLLLFLTPPLAVGTMLRLVGYRFADLTLEGSFLLGLLGGQVVGVLGGSIISLPAFFNHEWLSTPSAALAGMLGGLIRYVIPNKEDVWKFGPFLFLSVPRRVWSLLREMRAQWELLPLAICGLLELGRVGLGRAVQGRWLFFTDPTAWWGLLLLLATTAMAVAVPIKIWNNTRIEAKLEQHQQLLLKSRMDALSAQIHPHFLFNTLNTVSSLIRFDPDMARVVVIKLSNILRRLLRQHENFVTLRDELAFVDDYLDIEVVRFGRDKLQIFKEIDQASLDIFVPSMLLQPIVENALKHGIGPKLEGGVVQIRTALRDARLVIEVEDNGIGMTDDRLPASAGEGIGIANVRERLQVLYGQDFRLEIQGREGKGTRIRIEVPELVTALETSP
jgi:two-component system LytT family sensor kinase